MDNTIPTHGEVLVGSKYLTKDILGHLFHFQPYTTSNIQKPGGNLYVSTWLCMDNSIKTHGEFLVGYK
jgi:hypothetical protein